MVRPGKETEFWRGVNSFSNFFKHADKDPGDISDGFLEEANDSVFLIAATYYDLLGCQQTEEMQALAVWYMTLNPDVLSQDVNSARCRPLFWRQVKSGRFRANSSSKIGLTVLRKSKSNKKY